ncbi:MAG: SagB/ThcOx family dehydrogenase [Chloroflexota bacterium]
MEEKASQCHTPGTLRLVFILPPFWYNGGMKLLWGIPVLVLSLLAGCTSPTAPTPTQPGFTPEAGLKLPQPRLESSFSLEEALVGRRSVREFTDEPLTLQEVSQLLWSAQGRTSSWGRTVPSAGALYPLEVYLAAGRVNGLSPGIYRYQPEGHGLIRLSDKDVRGELAQAAVGQGWMADGAISIIITGVYQRTTLKYGERGIRYVHMEAGHAAQNIYLQATALNLGTVGVGAFYDDQVRAILGIPEEETPLYILPVGRKP